MESLDNVRKGIADIDKQLTMLFEQRMQLASKILEYKKECGLPIFDPDQESVILAKAVASIKDEELKDFGLMFFRNLYEVSRGYQKRLMGDMKVGYSGIPGAYAYIAGKKLFPTAELIAFSDFNKAYKACEEGVVDVVVLPTVNSFAGSVGDVMDLAYHGNLYINLSADMKIVHNLVGVKGAKIEDIKKVVSHPQALAQCSDFIKSMGFEEEAFGNTAMATKLVADTNDKSFAAIASAETAELYGLDILREGVNTSSLNTTKFSVFSRTLNTASRKNRIGEHFTIIFTVKNESGALSHVLNLICAQGFNMSSIHSRPLKNSMWGHYFYIEMEGDANSDDAKDLMIQLKSVCSKLKLVGAYKTVSI